MIESHCIPPLIFALAWLCNEIYQHSWGEDKTELDVYTSEGEATVVLVVIDGARQTGLTETSSVSFALVSLSCFGNMTPTTDRVHHIYIILPSSGFQ